LTRSSNVETHLLERSSHILTQDMERETVFRLAADFIRKHVENRAETES
jgi:esterase/lipase